MITALLLSMTLAAPKTLRVLFIGNSHTTTFNVPLLVERMVASMGGSMTFDVRAGGHLEDIAKVPEVRQLIQDGHYDVVVLQAAMVSSSHQYTYSQEGGIALTKLALKAGSRALLYAEWPRQGIDENEYTLDVYRGIAKETGADLAPVGYAWERVLKANPTLDLWSDGNHCSAKGAFLAAEVLYRWITRDKEGIPSFRSDAVSAAEAKLFERVARELYVKEIGKGA